MILLVKFNNNTRKNNQTTARMLHAHTPTCNCEIRIYRLKYTVLEQSLQFGQFSIIVLKKRYKFWTLSRHAKKSFIYPKTMTCEKDILSVEARSTAI